MLSFRTHRALPALSVVAVAVSVAACDGSSGSSSSAALSAQAIDGYLVGSEVYCDGEANGKTVAAGTLTCSAGTDLIKIIGGSDVGSDETATDGGEAFRGQLLAPGNLGYVTPLTNVAVELSGGEGAFDAREFAGSVQILADALGITGLDLSVDPTDETSDVGKRMAKVNAQLSQLTASFGVSTNDYAATAAALASTIRTQSEAGNFQLDLDQDSVAIMALVNSTLRSQGSNLTKSPAQLAQISASVAAVNAAIGAAEDLDAIDAAAKEAPPVTWAMTIERDETLISYDARGTAGGAIENISLDTFESSTQSQGRYATVIDGSGRVSVDTDSFTIENDIDDTVTVGFSLEATGADDMRAISVVADAKIEADAGDSDSLSVMLPAPSKLLITSVAADGTETNEVIELLTDHQFVAGNGGLNISFWNVDERLDELGFGDLTATEGNYRMTAVISELEISVRDGETVDQAPSRTVVGNRLAASGSGFVGYVTIVPEGN